MPDVMFLGRRVRALSGWSRFLLGLGAGAALALVQPPVSLPLMLFFALPVLLWLVDGAEGPRAAFAVGWTAGVGYFAAGLFWIVEPFVVDVERHGWMAPFALVGISTGLALFWAVPFALARRVWPDGLGRVVVLAALWTLSDYSRSHLFGGFPWALIGYGWVETPVAQSAALFGPHMLGFLTLLVGFLPRVAPLRGAVVAAVLLAIGWGLGALRLDLPVPERTNAPVVRIVQPNAAQNLKWRPDMQAEFYRRHLAATRAPGDPEPDVIIWSETAVPFVLGYAEALQAEAAAAAGPNALLILGIRRLEVTSEDERWFNSLAVLQPDGAPWAVYDKHHLVPFGEYVPLASWLESSALPRIGTLTRSGFTAGPGPRLLSVPGLPPFLPLICYEAIFPHQMQAPEGRPEWIVQITNDAWFGEAAGPYQHLAQARMRAIEQGLPLARAANTGISGMIDAHGRIVGGIDLGVEGYLDAVLPPALPPTLYARIGDLPPLILVICVLGLTYLKVYSSKIFFRHR